MLNKAMVLVTVILMDLLTGMEFDLFVPSFPELKGQKHKIKRRRIFTSISIMFIVILQETD